MLICMNSTRLGCFVNRINAAELTGTRPKEPSSIVDLASQTFEKTMRYLKKTRIYIQLY